MELGRKFVTAGLVGVLAFSGCDSNTEEKSFYPLPNMSRREKDAFYDTFTIRDISRLASEILEYAKKNKPGYFDREHRNVSGGPDYKIEVDWRENQIIYYMFEREVEVRIHRNGRLRFYRDGKEVEGDENTRRHAVMQMVGMKKGMDARGY